MASPNLHECSIAENAYGSSRLEIYQSFDSPRVVTLTFSVERIAVEITGRETNLRESGTVHYDNAPEWARSWQEFRRFML